MPIREATIDDLSVIVEHNICMAHETEGKQLDFEKALHGVRAMFESDEHGFYLLYERGGTIAGQLMITFEWSDWRNGVFWWIQSVYVKPEARRSGVFKELYEKVMEMAQANDRVCGLRLYVDKSNEAAREVYRRIGMRQCHYDMFEIDFSA